jgi:hypothetical protein
MHSSLSSLYLRIFFITTKSLLVHYKAYTFQIISQDNGNTLHSQLAVRDADNIMPTEFILENFPCKNHDAESPIQQDELPESVVDKLNTKSNATNR